ncbi:hypothetical protein BMS3Abin02_02346 [bacterium BMS3Abin02]|nr:hypothetical protein BMS3Abin02_02346 [bacterium BMS3Abin02]
MVRRNQSKKQAEALARRLAARKRQRNRRILVSAAVGALLIGAIAFAVTRPGPAEVSGVQSFADQGRSHIDPAAPTPSYDSDPATSGPHSAQSAACGIYRQEIPTVVQLHDLEHGVVMLQYSPDIDPSERDALETFGRDEGSHIIVAPRSGMDEPIVLTAWTKRLGLQTGDHAALKAFYDRYAGNGPERGVPCPNQVDEAS